MGFNILKLDAVGRSGRAAMLLVVALATVLLLGACGSSSTNNSTTNAKLDTHRVALAIEQSIRNERHIPATVICPTSVPQQKGKTFFCIATTHNGRKRITTPFSVTVQNNQGYVTYKAE